MGCTSSIDQIAQYKSNISRKILQKISYFKNRQLIGKMGTFLLSEQLREMQYSANSISQSINNKQLYKLQAGQSYLLSKQRRLAWKIAIFQHYQQDIINDHKYSNSPEVRNDLIKKRFYQISLDVNRTFPTVHQLNRSDLKITLQNLTLYFEGVGYTQGMNFHVGFLLLCGFNPQEAYQIFIRLSYNRKYLLIRNFTQNFFNVNLCIKAMEYSISKSQNDNLKLVIEKIQSFGMSLFIFVFSWFLSYFLYNFNVRSSLLIWDYLLLHNPLKNNQMENKSPSQQFQNSTFGHGFLNLINLAMRMIEYLSPKIIQCQDIQIVMEILRHEKIQKQIDQILIEQLINRAKAQSYISQQMFKEVIQKEDKQFYNIYNCQNKKDQENYHQQFLSKCKYPRRVIQIQSKNDFT